MSARRIVLAIFALALLLRLAPIEHGLPRRYVPDDHMIRCALGMAQDRDPIPPIAKYSTYPYLVPYLLLPIYASEYAVGRATGAWNSSGGFAIRAQERPWLVQLPARALMALAGALTCWAVYRAARAARLGLGAYVASFLSATCLLNVQLSTHERPWAATVFFGALAAWWSIEHARDGKPRPLLLAGAAAGLAFACHQAGLAFLALPALAWLFAPRAWSGAELRRRIVVGAACVAAFALVALLLGHPYFLRYGATPPEDVVGGGQHDGVVALGAQPVRVGFSLASAARLSGALFGYDPTLVVLGLAGLVPALRVRELRPTMIGMLVIGGVTLFNPSDHVRYLLPACMLLSLPAGLLVERAWSSPAARLVLVALLALPLVQALRFDVLLRREDTRAAGERALAALPPGSVVAIDHYGPKPDLSRAALERVGRLRALYSREKLRLQYFEAGLVPETGAGLDAVQCEDLFEVGATTLAYGVRADPRVRALGATPREVFAALGVTHFMLAERRPGRERRPLAGLVAELEPLAVVQPAAAGASCDEAFLPTEMDFPLCGLWQVQRPGPRLTLYALSAAR